MKEAGEDAADGGVGTGKHEMLWAVATGDAEIERMPPMPLRPRSGVEAEVASTNKIGE